MDRLALFVPKVAEILVKSVVTKQWSDLMRKLFSDAQKPEEI
jgi:hypothetical protein